MNKNSVSSNMRYSLLPVGTPSMVVVLIIDNLFQLTYITNLMNINFIDFIGP